MTSQCASRGKVLRFTLLGAGLAAAVLLAACGRKPEATVNGQVIGKIGAQDVTFQELQNEMRVLNVPADKQKSEPIIKRVLGQIVARKYTAQQAVAAKLDRQPTVLLDMIRAREQVLAGAYIQREVGSKVAGQGKSEIDAYIRSHPNQFGNREEFQIEQISFQAPPNLDEIVAATKAFKSLDQVDGKLNEMNVKHVRHPGVIDSATLPANVLSSLKARKDDDIFFLRAGEGATFFKVTGINPKPISGDQAQQLARRALQMQTVETLAADTEKEALAQAKFDGDYARIMSAPAPAASPTATPQEGAPASPAATAK